MRGGSGIAPFTPSLLFSSGEQGAWYDPSDISTLFQDAAGATPVTADGDPVGYMGDKSGNGNHMTQSISASRPIYKTDGTLHWLYFDGVDDYMDSDLIDLSTGTSALMVQARQLISANASSNISHGGGGGIQEYQRGNGAPTGLLNTGSISVVQADDARVPILGKYIVNIQFDSSKVGRLLEIDMQINGFYPSVDEGGAGDSGSGNLGNYPLSLGQTANMISFGAILRGGVTSVGDREEVNEYLAIKSGVTL